MIPRFPDLIDRVDLRENRVADRVRAKGRPTPPTGADLIPAHRSIPFGAPRGDFNLQSRLQIFMHASFTVSATRLSRSTVFSLARSHSSGVVQLNRILASRISSETSRRAE